MPPTAFEQMTPFLQQPFQQPLSRHLRGYDLRLLTLDDLDILVAMRNEVLAHLPNPDLHMREPNEIEYLRAHLTPLTTNLGTAPEHPMERGEIIGVFDKGQLVAYGMLGLPLPDAEDNLGKLLPIPPETYCQVAHIAGCMVREDMRGQGLQRLLLAARLVLAKIHGRTVCAARVSMHNHASRRNMQRQRMHIAWVGDIKGLKRHILGIHLGQPWSFDNTQALLASSEDFDRQQTLSQQGWWGVGEIEHASGSPTLVFEKFSTGTLLAERQA